MSAIGRPYHGCHRRIYRKAAAPLHAVVSNHGWVDGNKRTALLPGRAVRAGKQLGLRCARRGGGGCHDRCGPRGNGLRGASRLVQRSPCPADGTRIASHYAVNPPTTSIRIPVRRHLRTSTRRRRSSTTPLYNPRPQSLAAASAALDAAVVMLTKPVAPMRLVFANGPGRNPPAVAGNQV